MHKPLLLDLFCGAGGASMGYSRAGFHVVGVDKEPQPNYPFEFIQDDAIDYLMMHGREFAAIAASPPCQVHSDLASLAGPGHVDLIPQTRAALLAVGVPYVIENVVGAPLIEPLMLCGSMFGLASRGRLLKRHRLFESSIELSAPDVDRCAGREVGGVYGDGGGGPMTRGYKFYAAQSREAMGIGWMTRPELSQSIPPDYTRWIGDQLMKEI